MEGEWMTLREAGEVLGLSAETLKKQAQRGRLKAERKGRDWMTTKDALEMYRQQHQGRIGRPKRQQETGE